MAQVVHLLNDVDLAQHVETLFRRQLAQQRAVLVPQIANVQQPVVDQPQLRVFHRRLYAAATQVAADDDVFDLQHIYRILHHRQAVKIGVDNEVRHVAMDEQFTRLEAGQAFGGNAAVRATNP